MSRLLKRLSLIKNKGEDKKQAKQDGNSIGKTKTEPRSSTTPADRKLDKYLKFLKDNEYLTPSLFPQKYKDTYTVLVAPDSETSALDATASTNEAEAAAGPEKGEDGVPSRLSIKRSSVVSIGDTVRESVQITNSTSSKEKSVKASLQKKKEKIQSKISALNKHVNEMDKNDQPPSSAYEQFFKTIAQGFDRLTNQKNTTYGYNLLI